MSETTTGETAEVWTWANEEAHIRWLEEHRNDLDMWEVSEEGPLPPGASLVGHRVSVSLSREEMARLHRLADRLGVNIIEALRLGAELTLDLIERGAITQEEIEAKKRELVRAE